MVMIKTLILIITFINMIKPTMFKMYGINSFYILRKKLIKDVNCL